METGAPLSAFMTARPTSCISIAHLTTSRTRRIEFLRRSFRRDWRLGWLWADSSRTQFAVAPYKFPKYQRRPSQAAFPRSNLPTKPSDSLRPWQRAVLKVILQNPCGQSRTQRFAPTLHRAHDFSAANHLGAGEPCDLRGQDQVDFQLRIRLQHIVALEKQSRPADVFGCAFMPLAVAEPAIPQRQVKLESLRACRWSVPGPRRGLWFSRLHRHNDLRGSWSCIEHFAHLALQVAKVEGFLEQANPCIQRAVLPDYVFGVAGHVKHFHVRANFTNALGQLAAVHAWHDDVGQQKMDGSFMRYRDLHRDGPVCGLDDAIPLLLEILPRQVTKIRLVFHQQDGFCPRLNFLELSRTRHRLHDRLFHRRHARQ